MKYHLIATLSVGALLSGIAQAHDDSAEALNQIHHINQKEIQVSNMALQKTHSADVKAFAQHMIDQHTSADAKVQSLATSEGVKLQSFQMADFEKVGADDLNALTGARFDLAFVGMMKGGHKEALFELDELKDHTKDKQLKDLVSRILPDVKEHEKMANDLKKKLKADES